VRGSDVTKSAFADESLSVARLGFT
jgi:hypothetical protein